MAANVSFPPNENFAFAKDCVEFPAVVDGKRITCSVTKMAMLKRFGRDAVTTDDTMLATFKANREEIEAVATRLIEAAGSESDILIEPDDLCPT